MDLYPFNDKQAFNKWLVINNTTYEEFLTWFNNEQSRPVIKDDCPWMDYFLNSYNTSDEIKTKYSYQFGVFIDFIIEKAKSDFSKQLLTQDESGNNKYIENSTMLSLLEKDLSSTLIGMITPTLTLELNVARVSKILKGKTSKQRYECFIDLLTNKEYVIKLFKEYPLLWKKLLVKTKNAIDALLEFYLRLRVDYHEIESEFGHLGSFLAFAGEKGDEHNNGRSVRVCLFEKKTIVYKPRPLKADVYFQKLLLDLNKDANTSFKTFYSIDKVNYGWSEKVEYKECDNKQEVQNYYLRMGHYLALLYLLKSSDFHFENVIAHGEYPMLIDLETLFHIYFINGNENTCDSEINSSFVHTVLDSMMLPSKTKFFGQENYTDISAIGYERNESNNNVISSLINQNRDDMSLASSEVKSGQLASTPSYKGRFEVNDVEILDQLLSGFKQLYIYILKDKSYFFKNINFQKMYSLNFRCVVRATNQYAVLINHSNHPDSLRSQRERFLYLTQKLWVSAESRKWLFKLSAYEFHCLDNGNIPIFNFTPTKKHILSGSGIRYEQIQNIPVLDRLKEFHSNLSKNDLDAQSWIIETSMASKNTSDKKEFFKLDNHKNSEFLDQTVYDKLLQISLKDAENLSWINIDKLVTHEFTISKDKELDFFDGNQGVLLYLTYFAVIHKHKSILKHINLSVNNFCHTHRSLDVIIAGGVDGLSGYIYGLSKLFDLTNNKNLKIFALNLAKKIEPVINSKESFDIISGSAGQILSFLSAYRSFNNPIYLRLCIKSASHIVKQYNCTNSLLGLTSCPSHDKTLGGFSHGVSGISYSLLKLKAVTNCKEYDLLIKDCIDYEDSLYDDKSKNYIDLRPNNSSHSNHCDITAWCHGVVGVGLARLDILAHQLLPNKIKQFESEISRNTQKILSSGFGENHSLCHGDAGSLEYLFQVSKLYPNVFSKKQFNDQLDKVLSTVVTRGLKNGVPFNRFYPGLFIGSVGLAYQSLRFKYPKIIKNILLFT